MTASIGTVVGRYVYAFVRAADAADIAETELRGLFDVQIESDAFGELAAITSAIETSVIRPRRKLLAAHQHVVAEISKRWDMLPVSFGLVASDENELSDIVAANSDRLLGVLDRVGGKVEMSLVLNWAAEDVFGYLVGKNPELQQARDRIAAGQATRDDMIEVGRMFEAILNSSREAEHERVAAGLAPVCNELERQDPKGEKEIVRVNCLIDRNTEQAFEAAVHQLAANYNEEYAFSFNGPWPPYSFVDLKLSVE
jgi:hypothetical protein